MEKFKRQIAEDLLSIGAVLLRPNDPFTWASGIKSPIYCDNRLTLTSVEVRQHIEKGLAKAVSTHFADCQLLMGTATAGIAHAAIVAHLLDLPMGYVRSGAKGYGKSNQIEGKYQRGDKVVVVEDLISTAKSSLAVVEVLRRAEVDVVGMVSIFTYDMTKGIDNMANADVKNVSLCDFDTLVEVAVEKGYIKESDRAKLFAFRNNPNDGSWQEIN